MSQSTPTDNEIDVYANSYVLDGNKSAAWRNAFPKSKAKADIVNKNACLFHQLPKVLERVEYFEQIVKEKQREAFEKECEEKIMSKVEMMASLSVMARIKITDVCTFQYVEIDNPDGDEPYYNTIWTMKDAEEIDPDVAACIKSVTMTKFGPKIELFDKMQSKRLLAELAGYTEKAKLEVSGPNGNPLTVVKMSAQEYKQARQEMLDVDDC